MRPLGAFFGAAPVFVVLTVVAVAAGRASGAPPPPVSSGDPLASCTAGSDFLGGTNFPASEVEPFVAVDPKNPGRLLAVWQQDRWSSGAARGEVSAYSTNGGASWNSVVVPFGACADAQSPFTRVSDPWVTIGPDGIVYASAIALSKLDTGVVVATSRDGGQTWSGAKTVIKQSAAHWLEDKDSITADPKRPGTAYLVWNRDGPAPGAPAKTFLSITRNGGHTWSKPKVIVNPGDRGSTIGNVIAVDQRHGALLDVFDLQAAKTVVKRHCTRRKLPHSKKKRRVCTTRRVIPPHAPLTNSVAVTRSRNGGKTWSAPKRIATVVAAGGTAPLRTGGALPAVAVNPSSGRIYVAWADGRFSGGSGREIAVSASSDAGKKWSRPVRASSQVALAAFDPAIAVGAGGAVAVTYDDLRTWDGTSTDHLPAEVWATVSHDRGATFGGEQLLAGPFDLTTAPISGDLGEGGAYFVGDYQGLAATGTSFTAVYPTTTAAGLSNPTDLFATSFAP